MKTRRQNRYELLRNNGFLPFEARPLSKVALKVCPYFRTAIKERSDLLKKARDMGTTRRNYENQIKELYWINKWLKFNRVRKIVADPWKFLRDAEDKFKAKFPQYTSPWQKRWKDWRDYQRKDEATRKKIGGL